MSGAGSGAGSGNDFNFNVTDPRFPQGFNYMDDESFESFMLSQQGVFYNHGVSQEEFSVPETQAEPDKPAKRSHKGKGKQNKEAGGSSEPVERKRKNTPWTKEEKIALVRAWIEVSQDRLAADFQKRRVFWEKVRDLFHAQVGSTFRNDNMISGRWTDIRKFVGLFTNLHNRNANRMRASGSDDLAVYQFTCDEWKQEVLRKYGSVKTFDEKYLWELLRKCSKWMQQCTEDLSEGAPKRTKTSESGTYVSSSGSENQIDFDLNLSEGDLKDQGCSRRPGRDRGKKPVEDYRKEIKDLSSALFSISEARQSKLRFKSLAFLAKDFSHLPPSDQALMEEEKDRIRKDLAKKNNN